MMASSQKYSPKSHKNEELGLRRENRSEPSLRQDLQGHQELRKLFDLNHTEILPTPIDSGKKNNFPIVYQDGDRNKKKTGKRNFQSDDYIAKLKIMKSRSALDEALGANCGIDLELKLSSKSPLPSSCSSMPSSDLSYDHEGSDFAVSKAIKVPLILMGCPKCYLYVMVPKDIPKCPKCDNHNLIDLFQGNNGAKRSRRA